MCLIGCCCFVRASAAPSGENGSNGINESLDIPEGASSTGVTLLPASPAPYAAGVPIKLTASAGNLTPAMYRFRLGTITPTGTLWTTLREYASENTITWTPDAPGAFLMLVQVRKLESRSVSDAYAMTRLTIMPPVSRVTLTATPASQAVGVPVTLEASASDGMQVEYQFRLGTKTGGMWQWRILQNYAATRTCTWTPDTGGTFLLTTYARERGSTVAYQAYASQSCTVSSSRKGLYRSNNSSRIALNPPLI